MQTTELLSLAEWIAEAGLSGLDGAALVEGFCTRLRAAGLPLVRGMVGIDTLHPVLEGHVFTWQRDRGSAQVDYSREDSARDADRWLRSPFHHLMTRGGGTLRRRLTADADLSDFPVLIERRNEGTTDYLAQLCRFGDGTAIGEMDCVYSSWATDAPEGFDDAALGCLKRLVPCLALAVKSLAVTRVADTLVETYLGRDAGRRVLRGTIQRGVAEKIDAVLWFSDLRGFTRIVDTSPPRQIVPLLNDYADALVSAIHAEGGQVLKFIGDGVLAMFEAQADGCRHALDAAVGATARVAALNGQRGEAGLPVTKFYLALHVGAVFYGNIGSIDRLDFTVVGPAVNEVSRIATMCRSLEQDVLLSSRFAEAAGPERRRLVSVGRYALRGLSQPTELFTLDPTAQA